MLPKDEVKIPRISGHCKGQIAFTSYGLQDSLQTLSFIFTMCLKWSRHTFKDEEVEVLLKLFNLSKIIHLVLSRSCT